MTYSNVFWMTVILAGVSALLAVFLIAAWRVVAWLLRQVLRVAMLPVYLARDIRQSWRRWQFKRHYDRVVSELESRGWK